MAGLVAFALACGAVASAGLAGDAAADRPASADRSRAMDGVWRMDGYGQVFVVGNGRLRTYQTTRTGCLPGPTGHPVGPAGDDGSVAYATQDDVITLIPAGDRSATRATGRDDTGRRGAGPRAWSAVHSADASYAGSPGTRRLDRLRALPDACARRAPKGPVAVFDTFWQTFADNYPFFAAKGVDWQAAYARYRPQVTASTSPARLFSILSAMVRPLYDAHVYLAGSTPGQFFAESRPGTLTPSQDLDARTRSWVTRVDLGGHAPRQYAGGRIQWAELPGHRGYLRISGFAGYTKGDSYAADAAALRSTLDAVLSPAHTARLRGLVIDLRVNGGGYDSLGLDVASRLTDRPYLAYAKRARNDPADPRRFTRPQPITVRPARAARYPGPVAVLTSGSTVSAGETFTQALLGRPGRTVRVGDHTQGVFSDVMDRVLPGGWTFGLPNEEFLTADGRTFDGTGIPPDIPAPALTERELTRHHDATFDAAMRWLAAPRG